MQAREPTSAGLASDHEALQKASDECVLGSVFAGGFLMRGCGYRPRGRTEIKSLFGELLL